MYTEQGRNIATVKSQQILNSLKIIYIYSKTLIYYKLSEHL